MLTMGKMKGYGSFGTPKFQTERHSGIPGTSKGVSYSAKLEARNANRSRKKRMRRMLNRECDDV